MAPQNIHGEVEKADFESKGMIFKSQAFPTRVTHMRKYTGWGKSRFIVVCETVYSCIIIY